MKESCDVTNRAPNLHRRGRLPGLADSSVVSRVITANGRTLLESPPLRGGAMTALLIAPSRKGGDSNRRHTSLGLVLRGTVEESRLCGGKKRMSKKYKSGAMAAIHEMMEDLHVGGVIDKQTMRRFD